MSISPVGRGNLVKMLTVIEPQGIFWIKFICILIYFNIEQPLVCETVTRQLGNFKT